MPLSLWHTPLRAVGGGLVVIAASGLIVTLAVAAPSPWWALSVPFVAWAVLLAVRIHHPLALPAIVTVSTLALAGNTPGITPQELLFVALYGVYLVWFYGTRVLGLRHIGAPYAGDKAVLIFLIGVFLSMGLTVLHQGDLGDMANGLGAVSLVALYFPIREACLRHRDGLAVMTLCVLIACASIALGNVVQYKQLVAQAVLAEFVAGRRVSVNDFYLGAGFVMSLAFVMHSSRRRVVLAALVLMGLFVAALVATQARGQWITCCISGMSLFLLGGRRGRMRLLGATVLLICAAVIAVPLVMGDKTSILVAGIARRFTSIGTASTSDISLLSRFVEAQAVLGYIRESPVLGHGLGVSFAHFDIITQQVWRATFVHVGYVGMVYTYGLWGAVCLITIWGGAFRRGLQSMRAASGTLEGIVGLGCTAFFAGMVVLMTVSNSFVSADGLFVFTSFAALASGAHARVQIRRNSDVGVSAG